MVTPHIKPELHVADEVGAVRLHGIHWGSLAIFCVLLLLWLCSLVWGKTLYGASHIALVLAIVQLIRRITSLNRTASEAVTLQTAPVISISDGHQEKKS